MTSVRKKIYTEAGTGGAPGGLRPLAFVLLVAHTCHQQAYHLYMHSPGNYSASAQQLL